MAEAVCGEEIGTLASGRWKLLAEDEPRKFLPRGPSGDGWSEVLVDSWGTIRGEMGVGLELPEDILTAEAGVTVMGTLVSMC